LSPRSLLVPHCYFLSFYDPPTPEIYTFPYTTLFRSGGARGSAKAAGQRGPGLSAWLRPAGPAKVSRWAVALGGVPESVNGREGQDRKSTRLNSSHVKISYAVFCLKKKNKTHSNVERL